MKDTLLVVLRRGITLSQSVVSQEAGDDSEGEINYIIIFKRLGGIRV